jgi:hypothetical protein
VLNFHLARAFRGEPVPVGQPAGCRQAPNNNNNNNNNINADFLSHAGAGAIRPSAAAAHLEAGPSCSL